MFTNFENKRATVDAWTDLWLTARSLLTEWKVTQSEEYLDAYCEVRAEMLIFSSFWEDYGSGLV
jgi:hypothetical protein